MGDSAEAALSLIEALIEQLEAEGVLTPENIDAIYDSALARVQARLESGGDIASEMQARIRPRRQ